MAVVIRAQVPGMTKEMYEQMSAQMIPMIKGMSGFIAHAGFPIPGGFEVNEFWESQEQFEVWMKGTVMPASAAAGLTTSWTFLPATSIVTR